MTRPSIWSKRFSLALLLTVGCGGDEKPPKNEDWKKPWMEGTSATSFRPHIRVGQETESKSPRAIASPYWVEKLPLERNEWWTERKVACPSGSNVGGVVGADVGCVDGEGKRQGRYTYWNGYRYYDGEYYFGRRHGKWSFWDKAGNRIAERSFQNGLLVGRSSLWNPDELPTCTDSSTDCDRDGIANANDFCPTDAEDFDGYMDGDGCPDYDVDDGCPVDQDVCPGVFDADDEPSSKRP